MFKVVFLIILWVFLIAVVSVAALNYYARRSEHTHEESMFVLKQKYDE